MAKQGYKIPASLNQTHFDRMINLSKNPNSPIGLVSVKTIAAYIGTLFFVGSLRWECLLVMVFSLMYFMSF